MTVFDRVTFGVHFPLLQIYDPLQQRAAAQVYCKGVQLGVRQRVGAIIR